MATEPASSRYPIPLRRIRYPSRMAAPTTSQTLTAVITREANWYVARCLQIEVTTQGPTVEEALANLREALELYLTNGATVPSPIGHPIVTQIDVHVPG